MYILIYLVINLVVFYCMVWVSRSRTPDTLGHGGKGVWLKTAQFVIIFQEPVSVMVAVAGSICRWCGWGGCFVQLCRTQAAAWLLWRGGGPVVAAASVFSALSWTMHLASVGLLHKDRGVFSTPPGRRNNFLNSYYYIIQAKIDFSQFGEISSAMTHSHE